MNCNTDSKFCLGALLPNFNSCVSCDVCVLFTFVKSVVSFLVLPGLQAMLHELNALLSGAQVLLPGTHALRFFLNRLVCQVVSAAAFVGTLPVISSMSCMCCIASLSFSLLGIHSSHRHRYGRSCCTRRCLFSVAFDTSLSWLDMLMPTCQCCYSGRSFTLYNKQHTCR